VTNVANFGAFVDIGVHQDGLVHVSALSSKFVREARDVVKAGPLVRVKVLEIDLQRQRIALTMRLDDEPGRAERGTPHGTRGARDAGRAGASAPGTVRAGGGTEGGGTGRAGGGGGGGAGRGPGGAGSGRGPGGAGQGAARGPGGTGQGVGRGTGAGAATPRGPQLPSAMQAAFASLKKR
jgi:uncharacterized protein